MEVFSWDALVLIGDEDEDEEATYDRLPVHQIVTSPRWGFRAGTVECCN